MEYKAEKCEIIGKRQLNPTCFDFTVRASSAQAALPGQFAHIAVEGFSLRRPISICEIDKAKGALRFVFEVRGDGTEALSKLKIGDTMDILSPLGKGFTVSPDKKAIVVGGGIGTPPMLELAKHYKQTTAIIGFRSAAAVILKDEFEKIAKTVLCTDDGSEGIRGYVSDALKSEIEREKPDIICACGPHPMLKAVVAAAEEYNIPCEVSLEERMGCGVGACLVCACKAVRDGREYYAHVCKDGPVFSSKEVVL